MIRLFPFSSSGGGEQILDLGCRKWSRRAGSVSLSASTEQPLFYGPDSKPSQTNPAGTDLIPGRSDVNELGSSDVASTSAETYQDSCLILSAEFTERKDLLERTSGRDFSVGSVQSAIYCHSVVLTREKLFSLRSFHERRLSRGACTLMYESFFTRIVVCKWRRLLFPCVDVDILAAKIDPSGDL